MLEPRVKDKPEVGPEVWTPLPQEDRKETKLEGKLGDQTEYSNFSRCGKEYLESDLGGEHPRVGSKVISKVSIKGLPVITVLTGTCESQ